MTRLEEIEARLSAATPGPWEYGDRFDHGDDELVAANAAKALREVGL